MEFVPSTTLKTLPLLAPRGPRKEEKKKRKKGRKLRHKGENGTFDIPITSLFTRCLSGYPPLFFLLYWELNQEPGFCQQKWH
jgi:hypothetical protein